MDIFTLARLASYRIPWFAHTAVILALILFAAYVARYVWLNLIHVILLDLVALQGQWQRTQADTAKHRRLNELAIVETRRELITAHRQELVSKWAGTEVEIQVMQ